MFERAIFSVLRGRLGEPRRFLQVLSGPRQVGKTTGARQVMERLHTPVHYASADTPTLYERSWIEEQWKTAREKIKDNRGGALILDEVQKIPAWSEIVKSHWDADTATGTALCVVLLGSSPLLMQRGLTESLAGRFELIHVTHWTYGEMRDAFGWDVDRFLFFGGYPGSASLINDPQRWAAYIADALIETTISRDILLMTRVDKPALLRRLLQLGCEYSGRVLSYQKMMGQLQDAGNTTTLAGYLDLLEAAGFVAGLQKYAGERARQRASSPKLQVLNTALMSTSAGRTFEEARSDPEFWGRLTESAVGAHLVNVARGTPWRVHYWADRNREVDFVVHRGKSLVGIEVKSGRRRGTLPGLAAFQSAFKGARPLLIGPGGLPLEEFFVTPLESLT